MKKNVSGCPIEVAMNVVAGRWRGVIVHYLLQAEGGALRFSELRRAIPRITPRVLTQDLRELEGAGVLTRKVYATVPARVDYTLSARGQALRPALDALCRWGREQREKASPRPRRPSGAAALATAAIPLVDSGMVTPPRGQRRGCPV